MILKIINIYICLYILCIGLISTHTITFLAVFDLHTVAMTEVCI